MTRGEKFRGIGAGALSGLLGALAHPPAALWPLAWVALVPLFAHLKATRGRGSASAFFVFGLVYLTVGLSWIATVLTVAGPFLLGLVLTVLYVLPAGIVTGVLLSKRYSLLLVAPAVWVLFDWTRAFVFTGFPWLFLAHSQADQGWIIQAADLGGAYLVTALIVFVNVSIVEAAFAAHRETPRAAAKKLALAVAAVGLFLLYGALRLPSVEVRDGPEVLLVQGNIPQYMKSEAFQPVTAPAGGTDVSAGFIWDRMRRLTELGLADHPGAEAVFWPETMFPFTITEEPDAASRLQAERVKRLLRTRFPDLTGGRPAIVGAMFQSASGERRNSAFLIRGDGELGERYDKVHAVPGGEYIPLRTIAPDSLVVSVGRIIEENAGFVPDLTEGEGMVILRAADTAFAPQICYEICYPELARAAVDAGGEVLLNLTNYGWFPGTSEPLQATQIAVFRAIETRRPAVVCANTGVTALISPRGGIADADATWYAEPGRAGEPERWGEPVRGTRTIPLERPGYVCGRIPLGGSGTVYGALGDAPMWILSVFVAIGLAAPKRGGRPAEEAVQGQ